MSPTMLPKGAAALAAMLMMTVLAASPTTGRAGAWDEYVAGGTTVVQDGNGFGNLLDAGGVVCVKRGTGPSVGGGCVPFGHGSSIGVSDDALGTTDVAFQVCLDNDGDGFCAFAPGAGGCADDVYFSHDSSGAFHNPLGPLPTGFRSGCPGGPWQGYVVFLCQGVHVTNVLTGVGHVHAAVHGTITPTTAAGSGFGDFCGLNINNSTVPKPYAVV